jgi:hypothetical protein
MKTSRRLSAVRCLGPWRIAAIEETSLSAWSAGGRIGGGGEKRPLAILIDGPGGLRGTDPDGSALDREEIERLLPGALRRFAEARPTTSEEPEGSEEKEDRP